MNLMIQCSLIVVLACTSTIVLAEEFQEKSPPGTYYIKLHKDGDDICTILSDELIKKYRAIKNDHELITKVYEAINVPTADIELDSSSSPSEIIEIYSRDKTIIQSHIDTNCRFTKNLEPLKIPNDQKRAPEIFKIIDGGNSSNRIDVVFIGDGYTASERQQFLDDITRLTTEMFEGETFRSWLPLFNIWAIYVESVDTGIGYNGAKNTPFRLYRQAGQLRGIYTGNAQYARQVCQLTGTSGCDYPSLIGNDDFYGGLGGEFVISTKSNRTGTVVLRHEMGHNFVNVGEEYDNGQVYSGVNSARSINDAAWSAWLSETNRREERSQFRILEYPWADLSAGPRSFIFTSDGAYSRWSISVSVSAAGEADSLEFLLDGQILPWTTTGFDDREFYDWNGNQGFSTGNHNFTVRSKTAPTHPMIPRMIASVRIYEFGSESEYISNNSHVSFYPTWDVGRRKTFRPTNAGCLMRNMTFTHFCSVCKEGMWYQFLNRISLIDNVNVTGNVGNQKATVNTLKLGQWRPIGNELEGEQLQIRWARNGVDQQEFNDQLTVENIEAGNWRVTVTLITPEVRSDPNGLLTDSQIFTIL